MYKGRINMDYYDNFSYDLPFRSGFNRYDIYPGLKISGKLNEEF